MFDVKCSNGFYLAQKHLLSHFQSIHWKWQSGWTIYSFSQSFDPSQNLYGDRNWITTAIFPILIYDNNWRKKYSTRIFPFFSSIRVQFEQNMAFRISSCFKLLWNNIKSTITVWWCLQILLPLTEKSIRTCTPLLFCVAHSISLLLFFCFHSFRFCVKFKLHSQYKMHLQSLFRI